MKKRTISGARCGTTLRMRRCRGRDLTAVEQQQNRRSPGSGGNVQIANPWSDTTLAQIRAMGYALTLPDGAENSAFTALNADETGAEMVQASYTLDGTAYTCRAAKASDPEDISGLYETWDQDLSWTVGEAQLQLCTNNLTGYVSWFLPDEGQQWCVSSSGSDAELLENARILAAGLGQELATAPEGQRTLSSVSFHRTAAPWQRPPSR